MPRLSNNPTFRGAMKFAIWIALSIIMMRVTNSLFYIVMAIAAISFAASRKTGLAIATYIVMTSMNMMNPLIVPHIASMNNRLSIFAISGALVATAMSRKGNSKVPVGGLFIYLVVALMLSFNSYVPIISCLKIVNFAIYLAVIYWGMQNLENKIEQLTIIRHAILGLFVVFIYGSLATLPFPAIAYLTSMAGIINMYGVQYANSVYASSDSMALFAGVTCHSQFMGPLLSCIFASVCCDAFVVDRRMDLLHLLIIAPIPIMQYMTRSRASLLSLAVFGVVLIMYMLPRLRMSASAKSRVVSIIITGSLALAVLGGYYEVRDQRLSKWIRKTQNVAADERSLGDAITASRMGVVELCMSDFRSSPMFGTGFQTASWHKAALASGAISIFSAPIEKGVLPLMVLGETGIVGGAVFLSFLVSFATICAKKRYIATLALFIVLFATNMAEATFFSPSGGGGIFWLITVCAGFFYDLLAKAQNRQGVTMAMQYRHDVLVPKSHIVGYK